MAALTAGTRLGTYEIVGPLGAGGMGEVYRARDLRLGREVAVKVLPAEVASSPDRLARFEREARTVAGLNHPNIVTLHSVEEEDGIRFLTMELVEGQSLADLVAPGGLPLARVLDLGVAIADALAAAHDKGVVHRDLKPANVMVTREGRVKVLDFGLAKPSTTGHSATQAPTLEVLRSESGLMVGTVPYMSPEQIRGEPADARSDLFAFGIVLYELLAGRRPFGGATAMVVCATILNEAPAPLSNLRTDLPADIERIVDRCLQKGRRERFQTALDVLNELRWVRGALESGTLESTTRRAASIAVLPFANRSGNEEDEYFSDGLADELLSMLAKIRGLRVAARTSAFHFKGKDVTLAEIGKALNVAAILDGSVRKAGNRVRISVQLVKVADGYHLWSETYDRTLDDIFAVQDDIAQSVVKELRTTLMGEVSTPDASTEVKEAVARAAKGRGTNPEAYRLYLVARHFIDRSNREELAKAIDYLIQSLALDPGFAQGWASLGQAHALRAGRGWAVAAEGYEASRRAVERALALEPDLAEAHAHLGWVQIYRDRDWRGAQASYARALELAPGNTLALRGAGSLAYGLGHLDESIHLHERSVGQDPLSSAAHNVLGLALYRAERFAEAEQAYRKALELAPQRATTHGHLALALLARGQVAQALAEAAAEPALWNRLYTQAILHHALGNRAESNQALEDLIAAHGEDSAAQIAEVHGARGEVDAAFEWIERAYAQADPGLSEIKACAHMRSLHGDPRWGAVLKKLGFED